MFDICLSLNFCIAVTEMCGDANRLTDWLVLGGRRRHLSSDDRCGLCPRQSADRLQRLRNSRSAILTKQRIEVDAGTEVDAGFGDQRPSDGVDAEGEHAGGHQEVAAAA